MLDPIALTIRLSSSSLAFCSGVLDMEETFFLAASTSDLSLETYSAILSPCLKSDPIISPTSPAYTESSPAAEVLDSDFSFCDFSDSCCFSVALNSCSFLF
jgi:hypothetical protein